MKRVVSVSLGSSKGDKSHTVEILGEEFCIERIGVDGDLNRFRDMLAELDGKVDAIGIGGTDIFVVVGEKKYAFRQISNLVSVVKRTPVADGSGLKHTLERESIQRLQRDGIVDFAKERVLLVSAVDRYGMAQSLDELCPNVIYGDLLFGVGVPIPITSYKWVRILGSLLLPIITKLPFKWFYPTGKQQESRKPKFPKIFEWATFICGDTHLIRRYRPDSLKGKIILTQTVRKAHIEEFRSAGVERLITTTPVMGGETFATNVMEAVIVALLGQSPAEISADDTMRVLKQLEWKPAVMELQSGAVDADSGTFAPVSPL